MKAMTTSARWQRQADVISSGQAARGCVIFLTATLWRRAQRRTLAVFYTERIPTI
jgi:hypothetical protein